MIEIWDRARHEADLEHTRQHYAEYGDTLKDFGL